MSKLLLRHLKSYASDPTLVDKLIVSAFLKHKGINTTQNKLINTHILRDGDEGFEFIEELNEFDNLSTIEDLIQVFEFVVSPEDKLVNGAVYTPPEIRNFIVETALGTHRNLGTVKIYDPACGCAGFLYSAALRLRKMLRKSYHAIYSEHLFGLDIQPYSTRRSALLLCLAAIIDNEDAEAFDFNIRVGNALDYEWLTSRHDALRFDVVVGNPPYVCSRHMDQHSRKLLEKWSVCTSGHPDMYIPFFELGLKCLQPGGVLGYITVNSFFKSLNGRGLRNYFATNGYEIRIIDFGAHRVFRSRSAYTCLCFIRKSPSPIVDYSHVSRVEDLKHRPSFHKFPYASLDHNDGWNFRQIDIINIIEKAGQPLGRKFKSRCGIATLKNDIYIFTPASETRSCYVMDNGYEIEKTICRDIVNSNRLTRGNSISSIMEKAIFPYFYTEEGACVYQEDVFKKHFPKAYAYLRSKKSDLAKRDKGKGEYGVWYAYGRRQCLEKIKHKLLFPHICRMPPRCAVSDDPHLLFHNGMAIIGKNTRELTVLMKILQSKVFSFYITHSSKPYNSGYYTLGRSYIKNFGLIDLSKADEDFLLAEQKTEVVDKFLEEKYGIRLTA